MAETSLQERPRTTEVDSNRALNRRFIQFFQYHLKTNLARGFDSSLVEVSSDRRATDISLADSSS